MSKVNFKRRPTTKLSEVVDSDLLTATEKVIMGELGGFYKMADESAYFRLPGDKASMKLEDFEKKLKKELHPNFFIAFNPTKRKDNQVEGHSMGFYVPEYQGFVPLCKVGKSGEKLIPANSQGGMVKQRADMRGQTEVAVVWRGYVAAFEAAKEFIMNVQKDGIKPSRCINAKDFFTYKRVASEIGGSHKIHEAFEQGKKLAESQLKIDEAAARAKEAQELKEQEEATKNVESFLGEIVREKKEFKLYDANNQEIKKEV